MCCALEMSKILRIRKNFLDIISDSKNVLKLFADLVDPLTPF